MSGLKVVGFVVLLTLCVMAAMLWFCCWVERLSRFTK